MQNVGNKQLVKCGIWISSVFVPQRTNAVTHPNPHPHHNSKPNPIPNRNADPTVP